MSEKSSFLDKIKEVASYVLIIGLGLGLGLAGKSAWEWYNQVPAYIETDTREHFANVSNKVVVYTTQWCGFCKQTKEFLNKNNIAFLERDIEIGDNKIDSLYQSIGQPGVPKIVIGNKIINGFNLGLIKQELGEHNLL
ncbi:glutaredoxin family protein [Thalassomonas haliotis]|uniref:Glutaredoxin family protein n=1 Tax=Thalassomonas haliotis TaxID=485448 RepID=A0ABY7VIW1_9GAMM|nr:glutaredoxin family protein [Thalassomonas haliotis]WDE13669.1 glutaredoxin family protein [Thalassomonas haliotis]